MEHDAMPDATPSTTNWMGELESGRPAVFARLFEHFRPRLRRMVELRLDPRVAGRVDASDVLQEAYLDAERRLSEYVADPKVEIYVWLRSQTWDRLVMLHRRHLGAECRAVGREKPPATMQSSTVLTRQLVADQTSPSQGAVRAEVCARVTEAVARLAEEDREVLLLRHFEGLSNLETAQALGLTPSGASMRYGRALARLKDVLIDHGTTGSEPS
jgi:RNA polymerase sigma-70 factor (ECF subfamily)